jgi:hypothetical protein
VELVADELRGPEDHPSKFGLTSATPAQVQAIQNKILGVAPFDSVAWHNSDNRKVRAKMTKFVRLRGEIAHTGTTKDRLWMQDVRVWREFVPKLVGELDYRLRMWMTIHSDGDSDWWRAIEALLDDGHARTAKGLREACGVETVRNGGDRATYDTFLAFLERRVASGALEKSGASSSSTYRLTAVAPDEPPLFDLVD